MHACMHACVHAWMDGVCGGGGGAVTTSCAPKTREVHAPADAIIALRPSTTLLVVFPIFYVYICIPWH